jgi:hypothetical protein
MKRITALQSLFATLVAGCGPLVMDDVADDSGGTASGTSTTSASSEPGDGATQGSSTTEGGPIATTTVAPGETDAETINEEECWGDEVYVVPLSTIDEWIDETGEITSCADACAAAGFSIPYDLLSCDVYIPAPPPEEGGSTSGDPGGGTGTGTTTAGSDTGSGTGDDGATTGPAFDPDVELTCSWEVICGRGHAGLRSDGRNGAVDPVGRWAAKAAHAEAASVPAFLTLARELEAHGAPRPLCERARRAAAEEVAHARMMGRIATRRGAAVPQPIVVPLEPRTLEAIAVENAVEGCVRETWAALEASHQATHAQAPDLRAVMQRIAIDETHHAELARDVDAWCRSRLDATACARIDAARDRAVHELSARAGNGVSGALARATGLPTQARAQRLLDGLRASLWT